MRSHQSGEFFWPLTPDPMAHWSVYSSDSSGELEGYSMTAGQKRASDEEPKISSSFKRKLRFEAEPDEKNPSSRKDPLPPIKTFLQRSPDTFPIPTYIANPSVSKPFDPLAAAAKGTCTTERYAIGDNPGGGKIVRRIVSLHSWQNFVAPTTAESFALIERTCDPDFRDITNETRSFTVDESAVGFLKPDWQ